MKTITPKRSSTLIGLFVLCTVMALVLANQASSEGPGNPGADRVKAPVRVFDVGLGRHTFKFQAGRDMQNLYLGAAQLQQALQTQQAQPRSMVSDDFNGDGMGDLVIGYANNGSGILSLRAGNVQAIAPTDPDVFEGIQHGRYPAPFLPEARLYALPEAPDFLQVGDFNADGYEDVLAAARGGAKLYLLAGDGRGNLGALQEFELPGPLSALQANDFRQAGVFTSLALGLRTSAGTRALIYNQAGGGLAGAPESYSMPGDVTAFAFGRLDEDGETDLAAATTNQVLVIHGRSEQPAEAGKGALSVSAQRTPAVETESLPFVIKGLAVGDFVWDRNHQREIAVLSDDGTVVLSARGNPDTRPYTDDEKKTLRELKQSYTFNKIDMETFRAESNKLIRENRTAGWNAAETISSGAAPASTSSGQALFQRSNASNLPTDDLLIGNGTDNRVQLVKNQRDATKLKIEAKANSVDLTQISADSAPVAAVSMRLGIDTRPGTVVLQAGKIEPEVGIITPDATFTVNSNADLADTVPTAANATCLASNGLCTLRAAIMQSNHTGGSNAIIVPDNTYTLSLGTPDDEAHTFGATEQSGDLDIFNWNSFDGSPVLTAVSITGGTRDGCIVQVGNFTPYTPQSGAAVPNNKERILEVNDGVTVQSKINVTLTNLTFQNAVEPTNDGTFLDGGAIWYDGSDANANTNVGLLTLHNVKLTGNTSAGQGGGVHVGFGSLKIESTSIVSANTALHKVGGGVNYHGGNTIETQTLVIDNSTIGGALVSDGNTASDATFGAGGGVDTDGGAGVTISGGTVIRHNVANSVTGNNGGGGMQILNGATFALSNSTISDNTCKNHGGGLLSNGIQLSGANAPVALTSMTITGNVADSENNGTGDGGGIFNYVGTMTITGTTHIDGNTAVNGGGVFSTWNSNAVTPSASFAMTNGTIGQTGAGNGNNAKNNGGGFALSPGGASSFGTINLTTVSIANNTSNSDNSGGGDGGGIFVGSGNLTSLNGCIIDSNIANSGGIGDGIKQTGGTIAGAGTINVNGGDSISLSGGTFTSTSGTLNLTGNLLNSGGTFTHNSGTVVCNGSSAQTIGGTTAMTFNNLTINNGSGVNLGNNETVSGTLNLTNGILGVGTNTLTLNGPVSFVGGSGSISSSATGTVSYNQGVANQNVAPGTYGNLTFNAQSKVLPNGFTVGIAGTFTTGGVAATITGSTVDFNGAGSQTIPAFNYNNLTSSNVGARTLSGIIGVAGVFTPGTNAYTIAGSTIDFNGAGSQTIPAFNYNNLTSSNVGARTLASSGTIGVAGVFTPGTNAYTNTGSTIDFNGAGSQTIPAFNYNNLTSSNVGARTLASSGTVGVASTFTPGSNAYTITGSTVDFNGGGGQTIPAFNFNNLTSSNVGARTLASSGTIGVAAAFTPGSNTYTITGSTVNFNGAGAQTIPVFNFNNLTSSGAGARTLVNGGTIGVAGTFTPGANVYTITNNTMNFNGAGAQSVAAFNYHNLTISGDRAGLAITLASGNIGVASTFNPSATNNTWVNTGNTIIFNGTATQTVPAFDFFGGLTLNNSTGANLGGNVIVNAALTLTSGTLGVAANTLTLNGAVSATAGALSSGTTGTVNYNQQSNGQATVLATNYGNLTFSNFNKTLAGAGTIGIAGVFTPGTGATHTITGSTINFNGAGAQTIPAFTYNNLTSSGGAAARTLDAVNPIKIAGAFTPGTNVYTITGSTIEYNGSVLQALPSSGFNTYNNLTINNTVGATGFAGLTVNGLLDVVKGTFTSSTTYNNVQVDNGGTLAGTNATSMDVSGNWTINTGGAFTPNGNTVNFNGSGAQTIGGTATTAAATTFNNLTIANAGAGVTLAQNETVNGVLTLTNDLNTGAFTLTQPAAGTTAGASDVVGNYKRTGAPLPNSALTYGNPNNVITPAGSALTSLNVRLTKTVPTDASTGGTNTGFPGAVQRTYVITPTGTFISATLQLHYVDLDLNGNDENTMTLWRFDSVLGKWQTKGATSRDTTNNWVQLTGVASFSPWTFNSTTPTAAPGSVTGQILDSGGNPVEGAGIRMSGTQNRLTVTDAQGNYRFDNVETNGFYTVTPSRANFSFNPMQRSFSLLGQTTNAAFSATLASGLVNPLDTTEYFVRQQYVDFLGREPDEAGLNFWYNNIENCGTDADCRAVKRTDTSAAFFLSIEFQQTGYLVYRTYQAAYGDLPGAPVPVKLGEFKPDSAEISNGVVVNQGDWQTTLNNNKQAFMAEFAQRPRFTAAYPTTLSPTAFVDQLFINAGVTAANSDRTAAIAEFGAASHTSDVAARGRALRIVAENATLSQQEFNQAFVLMQYFGYMRRDANSSPDTDFTGYNFWLNKLNTFNGNFNDADMVKSFLVSGEYRGRFPR